MRPRTSAGPEGLVAARHALVLGTSLATTTAVALVVRLLVPRALGPGQFGDLRLAESLAEMLFVLLSFGVDMQLRRESALDSTGARRYLAGLTTLRVALGAVGIAVVLIVLHLTGASSSFLALFTLTASAQVLLVLNNSYAALEQASGDVGWLARTNFGMKLLWALAMLLVLAGWARPVAVAAAGLAAEAIRFAWFSSRAARHHGLTARPDLRLATAAIMGSLPFFVHLLAHNFYARVGIAWLGAVAGPSEVGLYGAAASLATVALMGMPLLLWVLVPSASRAAAASSQQMHALVAGSLRLALFGAVPLALVFHLGADPLLHGFFGAAFAGAVPALRVLAPTFGLAYVSTVCAIVLLQEGRTWTVAGISLAGAALAIGLDALLIPLGKAALGVGGSAQGAAWATLGTEIFVTAALATLTRHAWLDAKVLRTCGALAAGVVSVVLINCVPGLPLSLASASMAAAFAASLFALGGIDSEDMAFLRRALAGLRSSRSNLLVQEV